MTAVDQEMEEAIAEFRAKAADAEAAFANGWGTGTGQHRVDGFRLVWGAIGNVDVMELRGMVGIGDCWVGL